MSDKKIKAIIKGVSLGCEADNQKEISMRIDVSTGGTGATIRIHDPEKIISFLKDYKVHDIHDLKGRSIWVKRERGCLNLVGHCPI